VKQPKLLGDISVVARLRAIFGSSLLGLFFDQLGGFGVIIGIRRLSGSRLLASGLFGLLGSAANAESSLSRAVNLDVALQSLSSP
jgi:hypothetical protein